MCVCVCVWLPATVWGACACVFESGETERRPNGVGVHSSFSASCLASSGRNAWMDYTAWLLQWLSNEAPLCLRPYLIHAGMAVSAKRKWGRKSNDPPVCCSLQGGGHVIREIKLHLVRARSPRGELARTSDLRSHSGYPHSVQICSQNICSTRKMRCNREQSGGKHIVGMNYAGTSNASSSQISSKQW